MNTPARILIAMQEIPQISYYILILPAILIALILHEVAHGTTAYRLGDPTAKALGRLSVNPLKHLDPIGTLCMIFFRFGWARPVPINARYFKKPRRDMALTALAGPVTNLLLSFLGALLYALAFTLCMRYTAGHALSDFVCKLLAYLLLFLLQFHYLNLSLAIFNFIPIPPLDGSRILYVFLPPKYYFGVMKYERYISLALILALYLGILDMPLHWIQSLLSDGMFSLIQWIPFFS